MEFLWEIGIMIFINTILAQSLCLAAGYGGLVSMSHAAFFGLGTYTTAILSISFGFPFWINLPISMCLVAIVAYFIALVAMKTNDDFFVFITLGVQVIISSILNNWIEVTHGPFGLLGVPNIRFLGYEIESEFGFFIISFIMMLLVWIILNRICKSPYGRLLIAIKEDEIYSKSLGKNVYQTKVSAFVISAVLASIAGVLFAYYFNGASPNNHTLDKSIYLLCVVIIGGMRNLKGIFLTVVILELLQEIMRFFGLPMAVAANIRQILYGLALIYLMLKEGFGNSEKCVGD